MIDFKEFVSGDWRKKQDEITTLDKVANHMEQNNMMYAGAGLTLLLTFGFDVTAFAGTGIEEKARALYFDKFIGIAKWFIIGKGGWATVHKAIQEDFDGAKKSFISYLVVFIILLALPFTLDQVESVFKDDLQ